MNVLSLFDGMSCGQIALSKLSIPVDTYYASEIEDAPIKVTQANFPNTIQLGSITEWRNWQIDWSSIDLLIGGSPCQGFSQAGKQGGTKCIHNGHEFIVSTREEYIRFKTLDAKFLSRSYLFWEYVLCLDWVKSQNPNVKFMLENVKMTDNNMTLITDAMGVKPMFINSALVSAQNRQRWYWFNWTAPLPEDKHIYLKDIIEDGYVEKDKSWCCLESWSRFPKSTDSAKGRYVRSMMPIIFTDGSCDFTDGWREVSNTEMERLQTVPEGYTSMTDKVSARSMLGNGWNVDTIVHLFIYMVVENPELLQQTIGNLIHDIKHNLALLTGKQL